MPREPLPSPLLAARSLENGMPAYRQSRESIFVKQGKLLASYEDDYVYDRPVLRYFPTYQSLTDPELRGYFSSIPSILSMHFFRLFPQVSINSFNLVKTPSPK